MCLSNWKATAEHWDNPPGVICHICSSFIPVDPPMHLPEVTSTKDHQVSTIKHLHLQWATQIISLQALDVIKPARSLDSFVPNLSDSLHLLTWQLLILTCLKVHIKWYFIDWAVMIRIHAHACEPWVQIPENSMLVIERISTLIRSSATTKCPCWPWSSSTPSPPRCNGVQMKRKWMLWKAYAVVEKPTFTLLQVPTDLPPVVIAEGLSDLLIDPDAQVNSHPYLILIHNPKIFPPLSV